MSEYYRIQVASHLGASWSAWFDEWEIINNINGTTTLQGRVIDQPSLWGLLARVQAAGLTLLALERIASPICGDAADQDHSNSPFEFGAPGDQDAEAQ